MKSRPASNAGPTKTDGGNALKKALELIQSRSTMVLATCKDQSPWATPVYYLYTDAAFYYFSSPDALHTRQALSDTFSAATIYADGDRLDQIEGVQMMGTVTLVKSRIEKLTVTARYLRKFPMAKNLINNPGSAIDASRKVDLFRFTPEIAYYMDNRTGFGKRLEIDL